MAGVDKSKMIKIGVAVGALVIAVALISWTMFGGGGPGPETTPPPPPPPEVQEQIDQAEQRIREAPGGPPVEAGA